MQNLVHANYFSPGHKKTRKGEKGSYRDVLKDQPAERQRGREWWMWGSQQRYIPYLCLALSPLSAAKCQCQSNLCSAGTSPSTAGAVDTPTASLSSKHLPGTTTQPLIQTVSTAHSILVGQQRLLLLSAENRSSTFHKIKCLLDPRKSLTSKGPQHPWR